MTDDKEKPNLSLDLKVIKWFKEKKDPLGHKLIIHPDAFKEDKSIKEDLAHIKLIKGSRNGLVLTTLAGTGYCLLNIIYSSGVGAAFAASPTIASGFVSGKITGTIQNEKEDLADTISRHGWEKILKPEAFEHFKAMGYHEKYPAHKVKADVSSKPFDKSLKVRPRKEK